MKSTMKQLHVKFDLPRSLVIQAGLEPDNINQEARKLLALFLYEHKHLSLGKACEFGGFSYWEFADRNRQLGIPVAYSKKDLQEDLKQLKDI